MNALNFKDYSLIITFLDLPVGSVGLGVSHQAGVQILLGQGGQVCKEMQPKGLVGTERAAVVR